MDCQVEYYSLLSESNYHREHTVIGLKLLFMHNLISNRFATLANELLHFTYCTKFAAYEPQKIFNLIHLIHCCSCL